MDDFTKKVKISFTLDKESVKEVNDELDKLDDKGAATGTTNDIKSFTGKINSFVQEFKSSRSSFFKSQDEIIKTAGSNFGKYVFSGAAAIAFIDKLKDMFSEAWKELGNMLQYSRLTSSRTRDLAFGYGFSASQAYGFDKTLGLMNLSEEDLYYMNDNQKSKFIDIFTKYTEKYNDLYDKGFFDKYEEFQYEMADFKEELKMSVIEWIMNNKDLIKAGMEGILQITKHIATLVGWITKNYNPQLNTRSNSERLAATSDIIRNYSNQSNNTNVKIDNTFNNVSKSERNWIANAGQMTYEQIIAALS